MLAERQVRDLVNDLFEEEVLVIGGLVAVHRVDDDLVWQLVKNLDLIRGKFLRRLAAPPRGDPNSSARRGPEVRPHPAIEDFLLALRRA
jgi:hypothetical protein